MGSEDGARYRLIRSRRDFLAWLAAAPIVAALPAVSLAAKSEWHEADGVRFLDYRGIRVEAVEFMTNEWYYVDGGDPLPPMPCVGWKFRHNGAKYGDFYILNEPPDRLVFDVLRQQAEMSIDRLLEVKMEPAA